MKNILLILILLLSFTSIFSVNLLQNSDFELWSDTLHPASWYADSIYPDSFVCIRSSLHYSGTYSFSANVFTKVQGLTDVVSGYIPVTANTLYRIKAFVLDNDASIYGKIYTNYYDSFYAFLGNNFGIDSVGDNPSWQIFPETLITTTATTAYVKVGFRFYDHPTYWDGSGVIFIDSAYFGDTIESGSTANTPPQFSNISRVPAAPVNLQKAIVSCDITDNSGILSDSLFYRVNSGAYAKTFHDSISGSKRYFTIPGQSSGFFVEYYIWAKDDSAAVAATSIYSYTVAPQSVQVETKKILFDYTKNQTAGEADWIIDTNYPTPLPSDPSSETDWLGGISSWGFELDTAKIFNDQSGDTIIFSVYTLPPDSPITYGTTRPMDLKNYDVYIVCEPQNLFTSAESTAIFNYVANGGGLFMVADHVASDRDGDGWDSPEIWQAVGSDIFGIHFFQVGEGNNNLSVSTSIYDTTNSILTDGPFGRVIGGTYNFHAGTMIEQSASAFEVAKYNTSYSMLSVSFYGAHNGRVAGSGDSSPFDDSTGQAGNTLYDGWNEGIDRRLILNTTYWLSLDSSDYQGISENMASYSFVQNIVTIKLIVNDFSDFNSIRLMRKFKNISEFASVKSVPSESSVLICDTLPLAYTGRVTYRAVGIGANFENLFEFDINVKAKQIHLIENIVSSNLLSLNENISSAYSIFDNAGRTVEKGFIDGRTINVENLTIGCYFLKIENSENINRFILIK